MPFLILVQICIITMLFIWKKLVLISCSFFVAAGNLAK